MNVWLATHEEYPWRVRWDASAIYFTTLGKTPDGVWLSRLVRLPLEGSPEQELHVTHSLGAFDVAGGMIVFSDMGEDQILAVPTTGGEPRVLASLQDVYGVAVDGDVAYVTSQTDPNCFDGPRGALFRLRISDGELMQLADPLPCPSMVLVTPTHVYWVNNGGTVPGNPPLIVSTENTPAAPTLTPGMSLGNGSVMRMRR